MIADLDESFSCKVCKHSTISDFSGIVYPKASWSKHDIPSCWEEEGREDVGEGREKRRVRRGRKREEGGGKREEEREEGGDGNGEEGGKSIQRHTLIHSNNPPPLGILLITHKHR